MVASAYPGRRAAAEFPGPRCLACASFCSVFASSGVVFLSFIGTLLDKQPLYVLGVDHPATASKKCFSAAWAYAFIVLLSVLTLCYDRRRPRRAPQDPGFAAMEDVSFLGAEAAEERERRKQQRTAELRVRTSSDGVEMQSLI
mmetsp:Transcript_3655/g.11341  ORF Transcript_3655/g.11341 Transcript_3655/m.11341 type:complete len:143 (+) Transcript_3655:303-731(+)